MGGKFLLSNRYLTKYKHSKAFAQSLSTKNLKNEQYEYLEKSIIPTHHFQKSLTKLAIPKLEDTINRYLTSLKPLLTEAEWDKTVKITKNFQNNEATQLDKEIRELDAKDPQGNYINDSWFDMYLSSRDSIVLNYNPFIAFRHDPNPGQMNQAIRASNILISSVRFAKSLRENKLKPEIFHLDPAKSDTVLFQRLMKLIPESVAFYGAYMFNAYPLDMSQYFRLFNSSRVPKKGKDILVTSENKNHILVISKGNYYVFPVLDSDGKILKPEEILECFQHILNSNDPTPEFPVGVLTSENRDTWAGLRAQLETLPGNQEVLNTIDSALYCIALDDAKYSDVDEMSANFLSGDAKNRWFDKNYTIILDKNGAASLNFEHSWGDGVAVLRLFNELFDDTIKNKFVTLETKPSMHKSNSVTRLDFKLDDTLKTAIRQAQVTYKKSTEAVHLKNFELDYGRGVPKKYKLSPDSLMQSGIQCAYYKTFKKFTATYESASTSAFKKGRTETIRPVTPATVKLAEYMSKHSNASIDSNEFLQLMRDCTKIHNSLVKEGAMGQGFDRHLFALKYHAVNRKGQPIPEFYNSFAYKFINHNCLSTSTLAYPTILTGGFAPVVHDGFGIGYRILAESLGACVSSYDKDRLNAFVSELEETFDRIEKILKKSTLDKDNKKD